MIPLTDSQAELVSGGEGSGKHILGIMGQFSATLGCPAWAVSPLPGEHSQHCPGASLT